MNSSGLASGLAFLLGGAGLIVWGLFVVELAVMLSLTFWGVVCICIGIYMITHLDKEDSIEPIRANNKKSKSYK